MPSRCLLGHFTVFQLLETYNRLVKCKEEHKPISSGSRNFKTGGGGRGPGAVEFLGLGFVLMPPHTYTICL